MPNKVCPKCSHRAVIKNGKKRDKQSYKCNKCGYKFVSKSRDKTVRANNLREEYSTGKQTYQQLADKYGISTKTVQRTFDKHLTLETIFYNQSLEPRPIYISIDVSWFGEDLAVLIIRSHQLQKAIYAKVIDSECVEEYAIGVDYIEQRGWKILGVTTDGFKGLKELFHYLPYQLCQFHQVKIITKYLGKYPELEPSKELRIIALELKNSTYTQTKQRLDDRYDRHYEFLNHKSYNIDGKTRRYTHKKVKSAYRSLKSNLGVLFTYQRYIGMDNTTNSVEGYFRPLKSKIGVHCGLSKERKIKLLWELLSN